MPTTMGMVENICPMTPPRGSSAANAATVVSPAMISGLSTRLVPTIDASTLPSPSPRAVAMLSAVTIESSTTSAMRMKNANSVMTLIDKPKTGKRISEPTNTTGTPMATHTPMRRSNTRIRVKKTSTRP